MYGRLRWDDSQSGFPIDINSCSMHKHCKIHQQNIYYHVVVRDVPNHPLQNVWAISTVLHTPIEVRFDTSS